MRLRIFNGSENQIEIVNRAIEFSSNYLMSKRLIKVLDISVHFIKNLHINESINGDCIWQDDNIRPREFSIRIDQNIQEDDLYRTIFHEMVHVKQWATSQKKDYIRNSYLTKFNKVTYDQREMNYSSKPWEIEAYQIEDEIFNKWSENN